MMPLLHVNKSVEWSELWAQSSSYIFPYQIDANANSWRALIWNGIAQLTILYDLTFSDEIYYLGEHNAIKNKPSCWWQ